MRNFLLMGLLFLTAVLHAQEQRLLVGTYAKNGSEGIYVYSFDEQNGEMKKLHAVVAENPSYLALSANKKYLYAANENGDGRGEVSAYAFDKTPGTLQLLNAQSSKGDAPCYVSLDKTQKWVVAANYSSGNFSVFPVNDDGFLSEAVQTIQHSGSSVNKNRQEKPHAHAAVFSPDQKYLAIVDLGIDKIMVYPFDASKEKPVDEKAVVISSRPGAGPRHIVFHPSLPFAYVIEELKGYVTAYRFQDGLATEIQTINSHPAGFSGDIGSAAIKISPDGKFLYASNRGHSNTIAAYAITASTGKLKLKGIEKTGGEGPRDFAISPSGKYLLAANAKTGNIVVFKRNSSTGVLKKQGSAIEVPQPVCLVFAD